MQLILHVRKFFCANRDCPRKIFVERLTAFLEPWARVTTRLGEQIEAIGLASCGRLGARLGARLRIAISRTSILRRVMKLATKTTDKVVHLGVDDFSFRRGRTFGTVLVDLERHQILDLLPDRQKESAAAWMKRHPEITHVSRDRGKDYAAAAKEGAPQAIQVADRYHIGQNLAEAVQLLLARMLTELKQAQNEETGEPRQPMKASLTITQWRTTQGRDVMQDRPTAVELLEAVREFLDQDVMPAVEGRVRFHTRVAVNALGMLERELRLGPELAAGERARLGAVLGHDADLDTLTAELASRIRDGSLDDRGDDVIAAVRDSVRAKLLVSNPDYVGDHVG